MTAEPIRDRVVNEAELLRSYVSGAKLMQVATAQGDRPWIAHVWFASDVNLDLYFVSNIGRRHSEDIRANSRVAGGIVDIHLEGLGQKIVGVTFDGSATQLEGDALQEGFVVYAQRWPQVREAIPLDAMFSGKSANRIYRIHVDEFVLFDEVNFAESPRRLLKEW
jgi:uncharacterized protein YhbP (UPF0306 family)